LATFLWLTADYILEFSFPKYLESINLSFFQIGLILSLASVTGILIDVPVGLFCNKTSKKKLMISGLILLIIISSLIFLLKGSLVLAIVFLLWGFAFQTWRVPRDAKFASMTNKNRRASYYGFDLEVKYLGQTIGALAGGFILLYLSFAGIISAYVLLVILAIIVLIFGLKESNNRSFIKSMKLFNFSSLTYELKKIRNFKAFGILLLLISLLLTGWEQILLTFGPLFYGNDVLGMNPGLGGILLACFSFLGIFLSCPAGKLADKFGKKKILILGLFIMGASLILFSISSNFIFIFSSAILISIGWTFSFPAASGLIIDLSYNEKKGEIAGIWDFFMDLGYVITPIIGGFVAEIFGIRSVFLGIGLFLILVNIFIIFNKNYNKT